jgi:hypothetical protein
MLEIDIYKGVKLPLSCLFVDVCSLQSEDNSLFEGDDDEYKCFDAPGKHSVQATYVKVLFAAAVPRFISMGFHRSLRPYGRSARSGY